MQNLSLFLQKIDWIVALGCVIWGVIGFYVFDYSLKETLFWVGGGALGLLLAVINPAKLMQARLKKNFVKKGS